MSEDLTLFGRMVERLLDERGLEDVADLPLDNKEAIKQRMRKKGYPVGDLGPLADLLELSEPEKGQLAWAYVYDNPGASLSA